MIELDCESGYYYGDEGVYRTPAAKPKPPTPKPLYGLLRAPKKVKHECNPPGFWKRLWMRLIGRPVREGSMYRCPGDCVFIHFARIKQGSEFENNSVGTVGTS